MIRLLLLGIAFTLAPPVQAQWANLNQPSDRFRWEDGAFVSPAQGWIINGFGEIYETTDGGDAWTLQSRSDVLFRTMAFVSETKGWVGVLFDDAQLYETTDGGLTMQDVTDRIQPAIEGGLCGLFAIDEQTIWGAGQYTSPAYVIHTTDGGATWTSRDMSDLADSLVDIVFLDDQRGFAVGATAGLGADSKALILATEDGGATWTRRATSSGAEEGRNEQAWKISFPTPDVGFVSVEGFSATGAPSKILRTLDAGLTWEEIAVPGADSMQGIGFISATEGWLSGRGDALHTTDGGITWEVAPDLDPSVNRFEFFGDSLGYAMGGDVQRLRRSTSTAGEPAPSAQITLQAGPSPTTGPVRIDYRTPAGDATVDVFDALGRRVARLATGPHADGAHDAVWAPSAAARGVYVIRLRAGETVQSVRVLRL